MPIAVFILGGGGHTKSLVDTLLHDKNISILGVLDNNNLLEGNLVLGIPIVGNEDYILKNYSANEIKLINGLGSVALPEKRKLIFQKFKDQSFNFLNVIHPNAYIAKEVELGEGVQLMAGSIVQPGSRIGNNVIINTQATVDHDCFIGDHVHLAPAVTCCGNVTIGEGTHIGTGAVIRQGVKIASHCLIAAGAVVVHDITQGSRVAGIPAKLMV